MDKNIPVLTILTEPKKYLRRKWDSEKMSGNDPDAQDRLFLEALFTRYPVK